MGLLRGRKLFAQKLFGMAAKSPSANLSTLAIPDPASGFAPLASMPRKTIVHRDVPSLPQHHSITNNKDGPKSWTLGLARFVAHRQALPKAISSPQGPFHTWAPEQILGEAIDQRCGHLGTGCDSSFR